MSTIGKKSNFRRGGNRKSWNHAVLAFNYTTSSSLTGIISKHPNSQHNYVFNNHLPHSGISNDGHKFIKEPDNCDQFIDYNPSWKQNGDWMENPLGESGFGSINPWSGPSAWGPSAWGPSAWGPSACGPSAWMNPIWNPMAPHMDDEEIK